MKKQKATPALEDSFRTVEGELMRRREFIQMAFVVPHPDRNMR